MAREADPSASNDARLRRAMLARALETSPPAWLAAVPEPVRTRIAGSRRLAPRLLALTGAPDPARLTAAQGWLARADAQQLAEAARRAGLTYHLGAFGPSLGRATLTALTERFGRGAVDFALEHADLAAEPVGTLAPERASALVEADGARIVDLWAAAQRAVAFWLRRPPLPADTGSMALSRPVALAVAEAVIGRLAASSTGGAR